MIKDELVNLLNQQPTNEDVSGQPAGEIRDDAVIGASWLSQQKFSFELTVQQVEISNSNKASTICTENDLIKVAINLEDSSNQDAKLLQKIKSYPALIKKTRTDQMLTLSWNQTFHISTSMQCDQMGGLTNKEVIKINVFKIGQDSSKNSANIQDKNG